VVFASGRGLDQTVRLPSQIDAYLRRLGGRNLVGLMRRVHRRLDARPAVVSFVPPGATEAVSMRFDSFPVRYAISFFLLNDAQGAQSLPALYARMDQGDLTVIAQLIHAQCLDPRRGRFTAFRGMGELMDLSSNWSDTRRRRWQREVGASALGDAHNYPIPQGLGPWPDLDIPLALKMPLRSDAPALFLSGNHGWLSSWPPDHRRTGWPQSLRAGGSDPGRGRPLPSGWQHCRSAHHPCRAGRRLINRPSKWRARPPR
jgi:hypothetical protein